MSYHPAPVKKKMYHTDDLAKMFDDLLLRDCCDATEDELTVGYVRKDCPRPHWFKDNGSDILAVAHLDTVENMKHHALCKLTTDTLIFDARLDDRLGVYTILHMLPRMGIRTDVLFCTDEERGKSTGADFRSDKQYKWIVEFDRMGEDVVTYQYDEVPGLEHSLMKAGFTIGQGSFSDISTMGKLKAGAFNVGVNYQDYHSEQAHFGLNGYLLQLAKFRNFYDANYDRRFEFDGRERYSYRSWPDGQDGWDWYDQQRLAVPKEPKTLNHALCPYCYYDMEFRGEDEAKCENCWEMVSADEASWYSDGYEVDEDAVQKGDA